MLLSATYRQGSQPRPAAMRSDPANHLLWRMNPRRLDIEAYRDNLLQAAGRLDLRAGGPSGDLDRSENTRRTVYGRIARDRLSMVLQLYDFPAATMHSPQREATTSPLQQLFVLNSEFVQDQAAALAKSVEAEPDQGVRIRTLYRRIFGRDPTETELRAAERYLESAAFDRFTQALLATNEVIFWP
jgi:hypothetical protein